MLYDGVRLLEGSDITNLVVSSGTSFPSSPDAGELFYRTDSEALYVYSGTTWEATGASLGFTPVDKAGDTMTGFLTLSGDPTSALHAATKGYVDGIAQGITAKPAVRAATTGNLTATYNNGSAGVGATLTFASALPTIDGITLAVGNGVLVKNQSAPAQNGRYNVTQLDPGILTRCSLCDEASEIPGSYVFVQAGTQAGTGWVQIVTNPSTFVVGTDAITVTQFSGGQTSPGGVTTNIQFNNAGVFGGSDQLSWNDTTRVLTIGSTNGANASIITGRDGSGSAATLTIQGGLGNGTQSGGALVLRAGQSQTVGSGGSNIGPNLQIYGGGGGGTNGAGGFIGFYTQATSVDSFSERLRIAPNGAWGLGGANYGTTGQILTSNGSSSAPTWQNPSISISGNNTFTGSNSFTQVLGVATGTAAAPGVFFNGDSNTGMFSSGSDSVSLTTNGTERVRVTSAGEAQFFGTLTEQTNNIGNVSGNTNISLASGNYISFTLTNTATITFTNPPASGRAASYILEVTNGGAFSITWTGVTWVSGTAPTLRTSGINLIGIITRNGGTTYLATLLA